MLNEILVRPSKVAQQLGVSRSTIYRWFREGKLKGLEINSGIRNSIRISLNSVVELVKIR
jgi:excisionase family DNA binding protein